MSIRLAVVHADDLGMDRADHPADGRRLPARESGVLDGPGVVMLAAPGPMPDEQLAPMFAPAFIRAIEVFGARPVLTAAREACQWGVTPDVQPYAHIHRESARLAAAASLAGRMVGEGRAVQAIVPAGAAHHGLPHKRNGFGV